MSGGREVWRLGAQPTRAAAEARGLREQMGESRSLLPTPPAQAGAEASGQAKTERREEDVSPGTVSPCPQLRSCGTPGHGRVPCSTCTGSASGLTIPTGSVTGAPERAVSEAEISNP